MGFPMGNKQERDVLAILKQIGIRQCAVIGFSDGGIVGMRPFPCGKMTV